MHDAAPSPQSESDLVALFAIALQSGDTKFGEVEVTAGTQVGPSGPALIARGEGNRLLAFEARLRDWKKALLLAYRHTLFANEAYAVLPAKAAQHAVRYRREFELRGIGLCAVSRGEVKVLIEAAQHQPIEA